jgi:hypothetical protein
VLFKICFCHFPFSGPVYLPGPLGAAVWHGKDGRVGGRFGNLHVTNKYLQATSKTKRLAHDKLVDAFLPAGLLPKPNLVQEVTLSSEFAFWNSRLALIVP